MRSVSIFPSVFRPGAVIEILLIVQQTYAQFSTRTGVLLTQGFTVLLILLCSVSLRRTSVRSQTVGQGLSVLFLFVK